MKLKLTKIKQILDLTEITRKYSGDVIAKQGNYSVDAKSIMGLFSLDLLNEIDIITDNEDLLKELEKLNED